MKQALVVSPITPFPERGGSQRRINQYARVLRALGYDIDLVTTGLWPVAGRHSSAARAASGGLYRSVTAAFPSRPVHADPVGDVHELDEWWDPAFEAPISELVQENNYDLVVVNYVFLSHALELAPANAVRVLDMIDILSDRDGRLRAIGESPEFFYTTWEEEKRGLGRADVVWTITQDEHDVLASRGVRSTLVPHWESVSAPPKPRQIASISHEADPGTLVGGFIGTDMAPNRRSLVRLLAEVARLRSSLGARVEIVVAGSICDVLVDSEFSTYEWLHLMGQVEDVGSFYAAIDVALVPMVESTGQKIKGVEALASGRPLLATRAAFHGLPDLPPALSHESPESVAFAFVVSALTGSVPADLEFGVRASRRLETLALEGIRKTVTSKSPVGQRVGGVLRVPLSWVEAHRSPAGEWLSQVVRFLSLLGRPIAIEAWADGEAQGVDSPLLLRHFGRLLKCETRMVGPCVERSAGWFGAEVSSDQAGSERILRLPFPPRSPNGGRFATTVFVLGFAAETDGIGAALRPSWRTLRVAESDASPIWKGIDATKIGVSLVNGDVPPIAVLGPMASPLERALASLMSSAGTLVIRRPQEPGGQDASIAFDGAPRDLHQALWLAQDALWRSRARDGQARALATENASDAGWARLWNVAQAIEPFQIHIDDRLDYRVPVRRTS